MVGNKNTKNKQNSFNHLQLAFLLHVCPKDNNKKKLAVIIKMTDSHRCNRLITIHAISHTV